MAEFEWTAKDASDLVRRDRTRVLRQGSPAIVASALVALWLKSSAPGLAALFLGMCVAWVISVWSQIHALGSRWRVLQIGPLTVELGDQGLTWQGSHGTRVLRWDALEVRRLGATWILLVKGYEAAFLPSRCLSDDETRILNGRLGKSAGSRIGA